MLIPPAALNNLRHPFRGLASSLTCCCRVCRPPTCTTPSHTHPNAHTSHTTVSHTAFTHRSLPRIHRSALPACSQHHVARAVPTVPAHAHSRACVLDGYALVCGGARRGCRRLGRGAPRRGVAAGSSAILSIAVSALPPESRTRMSGRSQSTDSGMPTPRAELGGPACSPGRPRGPAPPSRHGRRTHGVGGGTGRLAQASRRPRRREAGRLERN